MRYFPLLLLILFTAGCCGKKSRSVAMVTESPAVIVEPCDNCGEDPIGGGFDTALPTEAPKEPLINDMGRVHFGTDSSDLTESSVKFLSSLLEYIETNHVKTVYLYGHCDERGSKDYNYALGRRRVNMVVMFLAKYNDSLEFVVHTLGEDLPLCSAHTESCWEKNRRVEIQVELP